MDKVLDLEGLLSESKKQENNKLTIFEEILMQCHNAIKKYNKQRYREIFYTIPSFIYGKPKYNIDVLRNYIVWHLRDNGLRVDIVNRFNLHISWKDEDINIGRYINRKKIINNNFEYSEIMVTPEERRQIMRDERQRRFDFQKNRKI